MHPTGRGRYSATFPAFHRRGVQFGTESRSRFCDLRSRSCDSNDEFATLVELAGGRLLRHSEPPDRDVGLEVVLALDRRFRQPAHHRQLADVREGVGDRSLEQPLGRRREGVPGSQIGVNLWQQ